MLLFACFSDERELKFLTEAMTEDLITMLARIPASSRLPGNPRSSIRAVRSMFARSGASLASATSSKAVCGPWDHQIRVSAQLIDATNGAQLSADRFDGQAEECPRTAGSSRARDRGPDRTGTRRAEIALIRRRRDANPDAWSFYRQGAGVISLKGWSEETLAQATALLRQATSLDPDFALARAQLALFLSLGARPASSKTPPRL